jgi:hypothetical protein
LREEKRGEEQTMIPEESKQEYRALRAKAVELRGCL